MGETEHIEEEKKTDSESILNSRVSQRLNVTTYFETGKINGSKLLHLLIEN